MLEFNIAHGMLSNWITKYLECGEDALTATSGGNRFAALSTSKSLTEVERLRLIVASRQVYIRKPEKHVNTKSLAKKVLNLEILLQGDGTQKSLYR